ncbi:MAG: HD domain-containing protein [Proteobacteria bacterium]|nr:HD domain-containing protein [Pseudomonadota bacterium]
MKRNEQLLDDYARQALDIIQSDREKKITMLEHIQIEITKRLGMAAEFRDNETGKHIERIADYADLMALEIEMPPEERMLLKHTAPMHDVGKIGVPDRILLKPGRLSKEEFQIIKLHTVIGGKILSGTNIAILEFAKEIAVSHHERWDGEGYPFGLKKEEIPLPGMIVAVTDVFDALTSDRVYKEAWSMDKTFEYMKSQKEKHFHPDVVEAFLNVSDKVRTIKETKVDPPLGKSFIQEIIDGKYSVEELIERWR